MTNGISHITRCSCFLTPVSVSYTDICLISPVWSGATKIYLSKLQIAQNKSTSIALARWSGVRLSTQSARASLSWLRLDESPSYNLVYFYYNKLELECLQI